MSKLDVRPVAVTVYPDRARVTQSGTIHLEPGAHRLEITELTTHLEPDSVRVSAAGTAQARLIGTQTQRVYFKETPAEDVRALEAQIESLADELSDLQQQIGSRKNQRARLEEVAGHSELFATALAATEMDVDTQLAIFDRLYQRAGGLDAEISSLEIKKREGERHLAQLKNQLDALKGAQPRRRFSVFVELEVQQQGELNVSLSYVVGRAGWKPLYDLRLSDEGAGSSLEVGYLAQVTQQTGEAWEDIRLSLSTARPALASKLPELEPWYIQPIVPMPLLERREAARPAIRAAAMPAEAADMAMGFEAPAVPVEAQVVDAQVETTGAAVTYHVPGTVSIPADGEPHKVSVARFALPPELDYISTPRLVAAAYRRAKVLNDSLYTLLPGDANLFAGEEFIGTTRLDLTAAGGEILLYLGVEDRLKVERDLVRREVDKRLIGGNRRLRYGYEIRLENLLTSRARLEVHDQFPVSRHEEVKVRLANADPEPAKHSELNLLEWVLDLEPGGKALLRYDFNVEYPAELQVSGLP